MMHTELKTWQITGPEIERYSGLEVSELYVGNVVRGVYRPSVFRSGRQLLGFLVVEVALAALIFIFSLPLGFAVLREKSSP